MRAVQLAPIASRVLCKRGAITASHSLLRCSALHDRPSARAASLFGAPSRRQYSRLVRAFVAKHVEAWTDAIQPLATVTSSLSPVPASRQTAPSDGQEITLSDEDALSPSSRHQITNELRCMMRHVPHPVAIITVTNPAAKTPKETFRGMTVSTFNTVTLYPEPVISFNVKTPSESYNAICQTKRFLVHLLSPKPSTARLARDFARGNEFLNPEHASCVFRFVSPDDTGNNSRPVDVSEGEPPMLVLKDDPARQSGDRSSMQAHSEVATSTPNFPFILECRSLPQSLRVGSHVVILGKVVRIIRPGAVNDPSEGSASAHRPDELCLAYADTRFWQVAESIEPTKTPRAG